MVRLVGSRPRPLLGDANSACTELVALSASLAAPLPDASLSAPPPNPRLSAAAAPVGVPVPLVGALPPAEELTIPLSFLALAVAERRMPAAALAVRLRRKTGDI